MSIVESMQALDDNRIVDENGEVFDARSVVENIFSEYRIEQTERREQVKEFFKNKGKSFSDDRFIQCIDEEVLRVIPLLNINEAGTVMKLLSYLSTDEGQLKDNNGYIHRD